jgi:hypothetical protein
MLWRRDLHRTDAVATPVGEVVLTARSTGNGVRVGPVALFRSAAAPHSVEVTTDDGVRRVRIVDVSGAIVTSLRVVTVLAVCWGLVRRMRRRG